MSLPSSMCSASGVTSRPVTPVPPVVITTSTAGSSIQLCRRETISDFSSLMIARSARMWPAPPSRTTSVSPDRSSAALRLSEMVRTAMRTGLKARLSSIGIGEAAGVGQLHPVLGIGEARPFALCQRGAADRGLALLRFVHPVVAQHDADIAARFPIGDRFDVEQRIALVADLGLPARDRRGAGVVRRDHFRQLAAGRTVAAEIFEVALAEVHVDRRGLEVAGTRCVAVPAREVARGAG